MTFSYLHYQISGKTIAKLAALLNQIDPDVHYEDWKLVLLVIIYETGGSEKGFELAYAWNCGGRKRRSTKYVRSKWLYFKRMNEEFLRMDTLISMAKASMARQAQSRHLAASVCISEPTSNLVRGDGTSATLDHNKLDGVKE